MSGRAVGMAVSDMQAATGAAIAIGLTYDGKEGDESIRLKITNLRVGVRRDLGLSKLDLGQLLRMAAAAVEDLEMRPDVSLTI